jgi:hypothetical protein
MCDRQCVCVLEDGSVRCPSHCREDHQLHMKERELVGKGLNKRIGSAVPFVLHQKAKTLLDGTSGKAICQQNVNWPILGG